MHYLSIKADARDVELIEKAESRVYDGAARYFSVLLQFFYHPIAFDIFEMLFFLFHGRLSGFISRLCI